MNNTLPHVSIIILNWNGLEDTKECIDSVRKIDYKNYRIYVLDNGSDGEDAEILEKLYGQDSIILKNTKNLGFAEGNNYVYEKIRKKKETEYILLLNNDTSVQPNFLSELINSAEAEKNIGIVSPLINYYSKDEIWFGGGEINWWMGSIKHKKNEDKQYSDFLSGCCMLLHKNTIDKLAHLFNKDYFCYFEDADLCSRVKKKGYKLKVINSSIIFHKVSSSAIVESKFSVYHKARNRIIFMRLNSPKKIYLITFYLYQIFIKMVFSPIYFPLKYKKYNLAKEYFKGVVDGLRYCSKL